MVQALLFQPGTIRLGIRLIGSENVFVKECSITACRIFYLSVFGKIGNYFRVGGGTRGTASGFPKLTILRLIKIRSVS